MGKGMGSHQSPKMMKDEWLTPPEILSVLGKFDLDPCSPINRPWDTAATHYTIENDGLTKPWFGRVWCNPPYGTQTWRWLKKIADHKNGIALIFARTETKMFFKYVWEKAHSILFLKGRLSFFHITGQKALNNSGAPSVLVSYNKKNTEVLKISGLDGILIKLKEED